MVALIIASFAHRTLYELTYESRKALGVYEYYIAIDNDSHSTGVGWGASTGIRIVICSLWWWSVSLL